MTLILVIDWGRPSPMGRSTVYQVSSQQKSGDGYSYELKTDTKAGHAGSHDYGNGTDYRSLYAFEATSVINFGN